MPAGSVDGLEQVLAELNRRVGMAKTRTQAGLYAAGLQIQRDSMQLTPRDTGNLRASAYTIKIENGRAVEVGYTAAYAVFVHENLEQKLKGKKRRGGKGSYWETGQPKFLETALRQNERNVETILEQYGREATS